MVHPPPGGTPPNDGSEASLDPEDWDAFRARAHEMLDELIDHVRDVRQRPVWRPIPPEVRERISTRPLPSEPRPPEQIWAEVRETMLPYSTGNIHPRFWGWVHGSGTPVGILAEMITAAMNANLGGREHMPVHVERRVVAWFRDLLGLPPEASGLMVTGTSMGTLIALKVARDSAAEVRERGLAALGRQMAVYVSSEAHISARKAAELLGLGAAGVRVVPTDAHFRMDVAGLEQQVQADRDAGVLPLCVIATAGTVNTGAIDDLAALADLCEANDLWLHVDGAFGALLSLSESLRPRLAGIERAASVAFDFHKWMHVPYSAGCVIIRDPELHRRSFAARPDYLAEGRALAAGAPWFTDFGPELSRGFLALRVWLTLQAYGTRQLGAMIEKNVEQARWLAGRVAASPQMELAAPATLNIVCFRYHFAAAEEGVADELNAEIVYRLQESGVAAPSTTRIRGRTAIRVAITNHRTTRADLETLIAAVMQHGAELEARAG